MRIELSIDDIGYKLDTHTDDSTRLITNLVYLILVDGNKFYTYKNNGNIIPHVCIIGGDDKYTPIAAASIIAKVSRDRFITALSKKNEGYHWEKNFGYGTKQHLKAIKILGITSQHRKNFSPINKLK